MLRLEARDAARAAKERIESAVQALEQAVRAPPASRRLCVCGPKCRSLCLALCQIEVYNKRVESETPERVKEGNILVSSAVVNELHAMLMTEFGLQTS